MKVKQLDLDTRFDYMIVYKDKRDDTINTWTLGESAFHLNYKQMQGDEDIEFLGIYKKMNNDDLAEVLSRMDANDKKMQYDTCHAAFKEMLSFVSTPKYYKGSIIKIVAQQCADTEIERYGTISLNMKRFYEKYISGDKPISNDEEYSIFEKYTGFDLPDYICGKRKR